MALNPPPHFRAACLALFFPWLFAVSVVFFHVSTSQPIDLFIVVEGFVGLAVLTYGVLLHRVFLVNVLPVVHSVWATVGEVPSGLDLALSTMAAAILVGSLALVAWGWVLAHREEVDVDRLFVLAVLLIAPIFLRELGQRALGVDIFALIIQHVVE